MSNLKQILGLLNTIKERNDKLKSLLPQCKIQPIHASITSNLNPIADPLETVLLDPAGAAFNPIYKDADWTGGATSAVIYGHATGEKDLDRHIPPYKIQGQKIKYYMDEDDFNKVKRRNAAKYVQYDNCGIIHVISQDFRENPKGRSKNVWTNEEIEKELRKSYNQILNEYKALTPKPKEFRMVALSAGVFSNILNTDLYQKYILKITPKIICELFGQYDGVQLYEYDKKSFDKLKEHFDKLIVTAPIPQAIPTVKTSTKHQYETLLEWVKDDNPAPLNDAQVNAFIMSFEQDYIHGANNSGKNCLKDGFWLYKVEIAKANGHKSTKELQDALKVIEQDLGNSYGINDPIVDVNIKDNKIIYLKDNSPDLLYPENDPLWRYIHKYLQVYMKECHNKDISPEYIYDSTIDKVKNIKTGQKTGQIIDNYPLPQWVINRRTK